MVNNSPREENGKEAKQNVEIEGDTGDIARRREKDREWKLLKTDLEILHFVQNDRKRWVDI